MNDSMVAVKLSGVSMPSLDLGPLAILRTADAKHSLLISIGAFEAGSIIMQLEGLSTPRPLTHRLMASLLQEQGIRVTGVEIYGKHAGQEDEFIARLCYRKRLRQWSRDIRPSDALALAVETGAPIYAHSSLLDNQTTIFDPERLHSQNEDSWYYQGFNSFLQKEL